MWLLRYFYICSQHLAICIPKGSIAAAEVESRTSKGFVFLYNSLFIRDIDSLLKITLKASIAGLKIALRNSHSSFKKKKTYRRIFDVFTWCINKKMNSRKSEASFYGDLLVLQYLCRRYTFYSYTARYKVIILWRHINVRCSDWSAAVFSRAVYNEFHEILIRPSHCKNNVIWSKYRPKTRPVEPPMLL